jgi:diaminopimelate decarboxylase
VSVGGIGGTAGSSSSNEILAGRRLGGVDPEDLAERFGTPLYVYDLDVVTRQVDALTAVLPPGFELAYAVKANPALGVVGHLAGLGLGADVASAGELETAQRAGIPPERIVMTGPGKRDEELRRAARAGLRAITVESPRELLRLERIACEEGRRVPILLRAATSSRAPAERVRLVGTGGTGKFGMDPRDLLSSARHASRSPHLDLVGLHAFGASNVVDAAALATHVATTMATARELARAADFDLRLVDVGGGLGIPYQEGDTSLDLNEFGQRLAMQADAWGTDRSVMPTVLFEPGRFLVGPAGAYVARVVDRKRGECGEIVILDGGIHHALRPALVGQPHRVILLGPEQTAAAVGPVTIAGPLCSGLDVIVADVSMALPMPGDLLAILDLGAYGFTESMPLFLSHPIPAEIAIRDGTAAMLRPRLEPHTWLDLQMLPVFGRADRDEP